MEKLPKYRSFGTGKATVPWGVLIAPRLSEDGNDFISVDELRKALFSPPKMPVFSARKLFGPTFRAYSKIQSTLRPTTLLWTLRPMIWTPPMAQHFRNFHGGGWIFEKLIQCLLVLTCSRCDATLPKKSGEKYKVKQPTWSSSNCDLVYCRYCSIKHLKMFQKQRRTFSSMTWSSPAKFCFYPLHISRWRPRIETSPRVDTEMTPGGPGWRCVGIRRL